MHKNDAKPISTEKYRVSYFNIIMPNAYICGIKIVLKYVSFKKSYFVKNNLLANEIGLHSFNYRPFVKKWNYFVSKCLTFHIYFSK